MSLFAWKYTYMHEGLGLVDPFDRQVQVRLGSAADTMPRKCYFRWLGLANVIWMGGQPFLEARGCFLSSGDFSGVLCCVC
jgi:hypothetical protein